MSGKLTAQQVEQYHNDGYFLIRGLFDAEEIGLLREPAVQDKALDDHSLDRADGEGGTVRLSLWNHPGDAKVPDAMIKKVGIKRFEDDAGDVAWLQDRDDASAPSLST